jgi:predicted dinucleotide-binding enzyme
VVVTYKEKKMEIGILGAGNVAVAVGQSLTAAGHRVKLSSGRGPRRLTPIADSIGAKAATIAEAAASELVPARRALARSSGRA